MTKHSRSTIVRIALALFFIAAAASDLRAQSYISPLIGYDFSGDSGCQTFTNCEDKHLNFGVTLGRLGPVFGFETEFAYAQDFFGDMPNVSSSVLTVMGNVMLVPNLGPVRPYALAGLGLIKSNVELSPGEILNSDNNDFGWDIGGGVFIFLGEHVGIRGDIRHFHSFEDFEFAGTPVDGSNLDFGRASAALVFKF